MVELKPLIYTAFGWVLGLLSTFFLQWFNEWRYIKVFKKSLSTQLKEAILRLSGTSYIMVRNIGRVDREILQWTYSMRRATGEVILQEVIEATENLLNQSDEIWRTLSLVNRQAEARHSHVKKFRMPYLEANLSSIEKLETNLQQSLFEVITKINWLNDAIDRNNFFFEKTFDSSLGVENRSIISINITEGYEFIGKLCREIAEKMVKIVEEISK